MYFRALRTVFNASTKLKNQKIYKNAGLSLPAAAVIVQKVLPGYGTTMRHFSDDYNEHTFENMGSSRDGKERKNTIDERAQSKLNAMIAENPQLEKFIKILELEVSVMRQDGSNVPSSLRSRDWLELVQLSSEAKRKLVLSNLMILSSFE